MPVSLHPQTPVKAGTATHGVNAATGEANAITIMSCHGAPAARETARVVPSTARWATRSGTTTGPEGRVPFRRAVAPPSGGRSGPETLRGPAERPRENVGDAGDAGDVRDIGYIEDVAGRLGDREGGPA
ncbi:hypothetical protein [Streptosporangium oxazolinicum]